VKRAVGAANPSERLPKYLSGDIDIIFDYTKSAATCLVSALQIILLKADLSACKSSWGQGVLALALPL
jgi:hypothetical protein